MNTKILAYVDAFFRIPEQIKSCSIWIIKSFLRSIPNVETYRLSTNLVKSESLVVNTWVFISPTCCSTYACWIKLALCILRCPSPYKTFNIVNLRIKKCIVRSDKFTFCRAVHLKCYCVRSCTLVQISTAVRSTWLNVEVSRTMIEKLWMSNLQTCCKNAISCAKYFFTIVKILLYRYT